MRRRGFSLVELLVVVAILGLLVGLLLPAVQAARESSRRGQCGNSLRQIGIAMHAFLDGRRHFPAGYLADTAAAGRDPATFDAPAGTGWGLAIAPYLEEAAAMAAYDPVAGVAAVANRSIVSRRLTTFLCPSSTGLRDPFAVLDASGPDGIGKVDVEFVGDVARQLQMLLLVFAHRHMGRMIADDVSRHEHRIGIEAD